MNNQCEPGKIKRDREDDALNRRLDPQSLVGSVFLTVNNQGLAEWQGSIVAEPTPGIYLVELKKWLLGFPTHQQLVRIEDMLDGAWRFYDDWDWQNGDYRNTFVPCEKRAMRKTRSQVNLPESA